MEEDLKKINSHNMFKNVRELGNKSCRHPIAAKDSDGNLKAVPDDVLKCWETDQDQRKRLTTFQITSLD